MREIQTTSNESFWRCHAFQIFNQTNKIRFTARFTRLHKPLQTNENMGPQTCHFSQRNICLGTSVIRVWKGRNIVASLNMSDKRFQSVTVPSSRTVSKFFGTVIKAQNSLISWLFVRYPSFFSWFSTLIIWKEN